MEFLNLASNTRIYIAGHKGMVGSAFYRYLKSQGYREIIVRSHEELDLADSKATNEFFKKETPEVVIMAAGRVGGIIANRDNPAVFMHENLQIQLNIMKFSAEHNVKKLLFFASSCMYPKDAAQPMSEDLLCTGLPESTSIAYATAKYAGVQMCLAYNHHFGEVRYIPLIPNSVYGINDNFDPQTSHVLSALITRFHQAANDSSSFVELWGSGRPRREFLFADDLARIGTALLVTPLKPEQIPVNIGVGYDISIQELADKIKKMTKYKGEILWDTSRPDGVMRKLLDTKRLKNIIGDVDLTTLDDGLLRTYRWYLSQH